MKIQITVGDITLEAQLLENETARAIFEALPIESSFNTWGDEIYFRIPVERDLEQGTLEVKMGDLGYWPSGKAFCIFYGRTPASIDDKPAPASEVTLVGEVIGDATVLRNGSSRTIRLESVDQ